MKKRSCAKNETKRTRRISLGVLVFVVFIGVMLFYRYGRSLWWPVVSRIRGQRTVVEVEQQYGGIARERLHPYFEKAGLTEAPQRVALLIFKSEKRLELWAAEDKGWAHVKDYQVLAASGRAGPKLREGDRQVPEGIYRIEYLNPNSSYHLSMKLNYPNEFDLQKAREEGRKNPGSDIFIHGRNVSIGCVAVGDPGIEELFDLVDRVGYSKVKILIAPNDMRCAKPITDMTTAPPWIGQVYTTLRIELQQFPRDSQGAP